MENGVEAEIAEAELVDSGLELRLTVRAAHRAGIIGADRQVEEAVERLCGPADVDVDLPDALCVGPG